LEQAAGPADPVDAVGWSLDRLVTDDIGGELFAFAAGIFPMAESATDAEVFWVDPTRRGKITAAGLKLLREMDAPLEKFGREVLRHVGQEKLQQLIELLQLARSGSRADAIS